MNPGDRVYPAIVRDLLTALTRGIAGETHVIGSDVPDLIPFDEAPVRRVSFLQGKVKLGDDLIDYQFTDRDFELVGTESNPSQFIGLRFRPRGQKPAPNTTLTVNYYPERLLPTPITDINVGSVTRTLVETISREIATQYQQLQVVYESAFVETSKGDSLDKVAALVDTARLRQGNAVGKVRFSRRSGSPGDVFIPVSTAVSDGKGNRYLTSSEVLLLPNQATMEVWVHGEKPTTKPVAAGALAVIERAIAGIDRVTNDAPTFRATEDETDEQFRARSRRAIHATGKGTTDAIRFGLQGLPFVSAVTLTEYPDPAVPVPGTLRVDISLSQDTAANRRAADDRLEELRPAGIFIDRQWAGSLAVVFRVDLVLAGASLATSAIADVKSGVTARLLDYAKDLGPGQTLRKSRLTALVVEDERIADARLKVTVDGAEVSAETFTFPAGKVAAPDPIEPVAFGPVAFESAASGQPLGIQVDAEITATSLTVAKPALETLLRSKLETFIAALQPGAGVTFDALAGALRDDTKFAMVRPRSVVSFDQEGGGFTEVRDSGPAFTVPPNSALQVRNVRVIEEAS